MLFNFLIVLLTYSVRCHPQEDGRSVLVYEPSPKNVEYVPVDTSDPEIQRRLQQYLSSRRLDAERYHPQQVESYQLYEEQPRPKYEDYPKKKRPSKPKLVVEQYLKEVKPTTKTVFNGKPNYVKFQLEDALNKETPQQFAEPAKEEERQSPIKYVLQRLVQSTAAPPDRTRVFKYSEHKTPYQIQSESTDFSVYQNALLGQKNLGREAIYVAEKYPTEEPSRKQYKEAYYHYLQQQQQQQQQQKGTVSNDDQQRQQRPYQTVGASYQIAPSPEKETQLLVRPKPDLRALQQQLRVRPRPAYQTQTKFQVEEPRYESVKHFQGPAEVTIQPAIVRRLKYHHQPSAQPEVQASGGHIVPVEPNDAILKYQAAVQKQRIAAAQAQSDDDYRFSKKQTKGYLPLPQYRQRASNNAEEERFVQIRRQNEEESKGAPQFQNLGRPKGVRVGPPSRPILYTHQNLNDPNHLIYRNY